MSRPVFLPTPADSAHPSTETRRPLRAALLMAGSCLLLGPASAPAVGGLLLTRRRPPSQPSQAV
jgi:hypothetical protein